MEWVIPLRLLLLIKKVEKFVTQLFSPIFITHTTATGDFVPQKGILLFFSHLVGGGGVGGPLTESATWWAPSLNRCDANDCILLNNDFWWSGGEQIGRGGATLFQRRTVVFNPILQIDNPRPNQSEKSEPKQTQTRPNLMLRHNTLTTPNKTLNALRQIDSPHTNQPTTEPNLTNRH